MFEVIKNNKLTVGAIAIVIAGLVVYYGFFVGESEEESAPSSSQQEEGEGEAIEIGNDVSRLVRRVRSIQFNTALFDSPTFNALQPFEYRAADKPAGTSDPFTPIGPRDSKDVQRVPIGQ